MEFCRREKTAGISHWKFLPLPLPAHLAALLRPRTRIPRRLLPVLSPRRAVSPTLHRNRYSPRAAARSENLRESFESLPHRVQPLAPLRQQSPFHPLRSPASPRQFLSPGCDSSCPRQARPRNPRAAAPAGAFFPKLAPAIPAQRLIRRPPCPDTYRECCTGTVCLSASRQMRQRFLQMADPSSPQLHRSRQTMRAVPPARHNSSNSARVSSCRTAETPSNPLA